MQFLAPLDLSFGRYFINENVRVIKIRRRFDGSDPAAADAIRHQDAVMREAGAHLKPGAGLVSYVHSCEFRGHQVPHLVVQTAAGPVTVMVLVHESVRREVSFDQHGFRGVIVPVPDHGSLAVLEQTADADPKTIDAVAARVMGALDWAS